MTNLYLTSAAADAGVTAGSGTKWAAGFTPGASATHLNRNSVAGPTAPLQATDGAAGTDGTAVAFYTPPLYAVTIAGAITASLWFRENATANNVAPTIRVERCDGTGAVLSTIVAETTSHGAGEGATTAGGAADVISVTAGNVTDTTLSDGDRLRITLWIDDAAGQGGTGSMASGGRGEYWVNGPNGAQGQAQLAFTEIVQPQAGPRMVATPETSFTTTTTPKTLTATGALTDDLLVALFGGDNFSTACSAAATSHTSGSASAWTEVREALVGNTSSAWKSSAWADVTGDGDVVVSMARTQSTPQVWGGWLAHLRDHGGIGNTAELVDSTSDSVSLTVSEGSAVLAIGIDWDHVTPVTEFTPGGANDVERNAGLTAVSWYAGYWLGQAAGTRNYGIATNTSANFSLTVIEVLAPAAGVTGTMSGNLPALTGAAAGTVTVTGTAAGTLPGLSGAFAGTVGNPVTGTLSGSLPVLTGALAGTVRVSGTAAGNLPALTGALAGTVTVTGTVSGNLPALTGALAGTVRMTGTLAGNLPALTGSFTGTVEIPGVGGTLAGSLPALTGSFTGTLQAVGTLSGTLPALTGALAGTLRVTGTTAGQLPSLTGTLTGTVEIPAGADIPYVWAVELEVHAWTMALDGGPFDTRIDQTWLTELEAAGWDTSTEPGPYLTAVEGP